MRSFPSLSHPSTRALLFSTLACAALGGCASKSNAVFHGVPQPALVSSDEMKLVGSRFEEGVSEIGTVEASCSEKTARSGSNAQESCHETAVSALLTEKAAASGGTHIAAVECAANAEDLAKSDHDKRARDIAEKMPTMVPLLGATGQQSIETTVVCRAKVGRAR